MLLIAPAALAQRWKVQYFYDEARDTMVIVDLAFPSAERGIAVGAIIDELGRKAPRYTVVTTSDGGAHWALSTLADQPRSIFFLDDSTGWMVTDNAFWFTTESGRTWKRIAAQIKPDKKIGPTPPGGLITRVWFVDEHHGFACGLQKAVYETRDGGVTWTALAEAAQPTGDPSHSAYTRFSFNGKNGAIVGTSTPPRRDDPAFPTWMEPERAVKRRQVPTLTLMLESRDGGEKWKSQTAPLMGSISSIKTVGTDSLAVFEYNESFEWPSEVFHFDLRSGIPTSVYKDKIRVMDCALFAGPRAFIAAVEPTGKLNSVPIPGKVRILTSTNWNDWTDMKVDYKANARSLVMAGPDADHLWVATDTGMILHLIP